MAHTERYTVQSFVPRAGSAAAYRIYDEQADKPMGDFWFGGEEYGNEFSAFVGADRVARRLNAMWAAQG